MKKIAWLILFIFSNWSNGYAQEKKFDDKDNQKADSVNLISRQPEYLDGGNPGILKVILENIHYPKDARESRIQGKVLVGFVIDEQGTPTDFKIVKGLSPSLDQEAVRVVKLLKKWRPGIQKGKPVRVQFVAPVTFRLDRYYGLN